MSLGSALEESFRRSFQLYADLVDVTSETILSSKLPQLPSNTLGEQLWCVVGARESFGKAIAARRWVGFSCSLKNTKIKEDVAAALGRAAESVSRVLATIDEYDDIQNRLVLDLLEHEAAHHGQLIRYMYGLKLTIPESWKSKYSLEER